jgi:hypothetical protein
MAVVGDNRGVRDRPVAQRPDGSWSFEDARRRRDQRQSGGTAPGLPATGAPEEDLSALALSLADNLTVDGRPLSELETRQKRDGSDPLGLPTDSAPTAEEIMGALEAEQQAAAPKSRNGAGGPRRVRSPRQPSARQRRPHVRRPWFIAWTLGAAVAALLAVELGFGAGATPRRQPSGPAASRTAAPTPGLIATATQQFLATEHAADRNLARARPPSTRAPWTQRHRTKRAHTPAHPASGPRSSSTTTSSTSGTSETVGTGQQASAPSSGSSSSSASSGSSQPPPSPQPHTEPSSNSGSSSATPSKAALKSLVTGAGTCSCQ